MQKAYNEFYDDVVPEWSKFGKIVQFKVTSSSKSFSSKLNSSVVIIFNNILEEVSTFNMKMSNLQLLLDLT